jgi:hypothetical protein
LPLSQELPEKLVQGARDETRYSLPFIDSRKRLIKPAKKRKKLTPSDIESVPVPHLHLFVFRLGLRFSFVSFESSSFNTPVAKPVNPAARYYQLVGRTCFYHPT